MLFSFTVDNINSFCHFRRCSQLKAFMRLHVFVLQSGSSEVWPFNVFSKWSKVWVLPRQFTLQLSSGFPSVWIQLIVINLIAAQPIYCWAVYFESGQFFLGITLRSFSKTLMEFYIYSPSYNFIHKYFTSVKLLHMQTNWLGIIFKNWIIFVRLTISQKKLNIGVILPSTA